jgi:hypothetical protein
VKHRLPRIDRLPFSSVDGHTLKALSPSSSVPMTLVPMLLDGGLINLSKCNLGDEGKRVPEIIWGRAHGRVVDQQLGIG